jgi:hypothetical protein
MTIHLQHLNMGRWLEEFTCVLVTESHSAGNHVLFEWQLFGRNHLPAYRALESGHRSYKKDAEEEAIQDVLMDALLMYKAATAAIFRKPGRSQNTKEAVSSPLAIA